MERKNTDSEIDKDACKLDTLLVPAEKFRVGMEAAMESHQLDRDIMGPLFMRAVKTWGAASPYHA